MATSAQTSADLRLARQVADLGVKVALLCEGPWDVNLLALAAFDARLLSRRTLEAGHGEAARCLEALARQLAERLEASAALEAPMREAFRRLIGEAQAALPRLPESEPRADLDALFELDTSEALPAGANLAEYDGFDTADAKTLSELSLADDETYTASSAPVETRSPRAATGVGISIPEAPNWSLAADDEPAIGPMAAASPGPPTPSRRPEPGPISATRAATTPPAAAGPVDVRPETPSDLIRAGARPAPAALGEPRMAYLLAREDAFVSALEGALQAAGFEVHRFEDPEELAETIGALVPAVVLMAPDASSALDVVAPAVVRARRRANAPVVLLVISADGSIPARLAAMRAGADAFLVQPVEPAQVIARLGELAATDTEDPFRVLIVEDDRPQAVFAESILRKAGMKTRAVHDPLEALDALEEFDPELILMDLLMPGCNGIELTTLIRERERYVDVPIVFLSGEQNAERRYDALAVGGDDFLEKPIKPKFLQSAVTNRVRRARAIRQRRGAPGPQPTERSATLYDRTRLIERIGEALTGAGPTTPGGVLFLIVDGAQALRERLGLIAFDLAMQQAGAMLAESLPAGDHAARFGDSSFVVLATAASRDQLAALAERLSRAFAERLIETEAGSLSLAASIGIAGFAQGWRDTAAMVHGAERAAAQARTLSGSRIAFSPGPDPSVAADADAALRNATVATLEGGGVGLVYQPIASLKGGSGELFQVLLRIRDDRGRRYSAAEIVPMAERCGLIDRLDRAVLARCVRVLADRARRGRTTALLVTQSIRVVDDPERLAWLRDEVAAASIAPSQLILELRHEDVVPRVAEVGAWLAAARAAGLRTAIGAFEPNPAAMQSLGHLDLDLLRVSGRLTARLDIERAQQLTALAEVAHARGIEVVVPMVEDARTAAMLWSTGIDLIQGDFVAPAGPDLEFDFRAATL